MILSQNHYLGEYDAEIGRNPLFSSTVTISGLPDEYDIDSVEITVKDKEGTYITYSDIIKAIEGA